MVEISTSLLNIEREKSIKTMYDLEIGGTDYFHMDIMDGKFVRNDTTEIMKEYITYLKQISTLPTDVHLMVEDVKAFVDEYLDFNPNVITFHIEAIKDKEEIISLIKEIQEHHCKVGMAVKPNTNIEVIYPYLPYLHMVLVMTVEPGKGGQKLIPEMIEKVKKLRKYCEIQKIDIDIEVDGGINKDNINVLKEAGANIIVAGTSIVKEKDYKKAITELKK